MAEQIWGWPQRLPRVRAFIKTDCIRTNTDGSTIGRCSNR